MKSKEKQIFSTEKLEKLDIGEVFGKMAKESYEKEIEHMATISHSNQMKRDWLSWIILITVLIILLTILVVFAIKPIRVRDIEITALYYEHKNIENEEVIVYWTSDVDYATISNFSLFNRIEVTMKDGTILSYTISLGNYTHKSEKNMIVRWERK